jgi:hypothetical protein
MGSLARSGLQSHNQTMSGCQAQHNAEETAPKTPVRGSSLSGAALSFGDFGGTSRVVEGDRVVALGYLEVLRNSIGPVVRFATDPNPSPKGPVDIR